jgi:hypothetical protein
MGRFASFLVGLGLLVGGGVVHGVWTDRWQPSEAVAEAARRLAGLPDAVEGWQSEDLPQDPDELQAAGAAGCWSRTFAEAATGEKVLVILLAGQARRLVVHRPEHCYRSAGYEMSGQAGHAQLGPAEFWTGLFVRDEPTAPDRTRILWSWRPADAAGGSWSAPNNPRLAFARCPALYKLYVIRGEGPGAPRAEDDPSLRLLRRLLPAIDRALTP